MAHVLNVLAVPALDAGGDNLDFERARLAKIFTDPYIVLPGVKLAGDLYVYDDGPNGFKYIENFKDIDQLVQIIRALIDSDPDKPCLQVLEIHAHANPSVIDSLFITGSKMTALKEAGKALKRAKWCDSGSIYLSGCNTGLTESGVITVPPIGSIAQELAKAMPYDPSKFPTHITVYGSAGYLRNTHFDGKAVIRATITDKSGDQPPFDGARSTSVEKNCWNGFNNWK
jgi:hypothetical protein